MDSNQNSLNLTWWQRKKYSGKFIAYNDNSVLTSGTSYWDCRHKAREKLAEKKLTGIKGLNFNIEYLYVEKKSNIYRGLIIVIFGFILFELMMSELMSFESISLHKKIEFFIFYNFVLLSIFLASLMIINPVVRTQSVFGLLGKAIVNKERHLGWEVSLSGISAFMFLVS
ncbi:MAG: hypothetical protein ACC656_06665, partial [Candidatus Heimdallarchaeota archaeon]